MSSQAVAGREDVGKNPETREEAEALLCAVEVLCNPWDVDGMADGFTDDCVGRFGLYPEMRGREAVREFFLQRSRRQKNYRLRKELRSMVGDTLAIDWNATWEDAVTGVRMKGHGVEIWKLRGGKLAVWEAAFNIGEADKPAALGIV